MKRPAVAMPVQVHVTWPLVIWRPCCACGQEFRREWGWATVSGVGEGVVRFLCLACAPTLFEAYRLIDSHCWESPKGAQLLATKAERSSNVRTIR